jgi:hypothetical protein
VQGGILGSILLPEGSTAAEGHAAQLCLRALTVALLCFYEPHTISDILAAVIPYGLLNYDQEGADVKMGGPIYAALLQYVIAVAKEEDTDPIRRILLQEIERKQDHVSGASIKQILSCDLLQGTDLPFSIGVIRWVLTSMHRRLCECYPTRSLKAWALALVLSELGFQVAASLVAVSTEADYELQISNSDESHSKVILVTAPIGQTDTMTPWSNINGGVCYKHQLTPIRNIPWIAFKHLAGKTEGVSIQTLSDVWEYSFEQAQRATECPRLNRRVQIETREDHDLIYTEHKRIATCWSFAMQNILRGPMDQFIPHDHGVADIVQRCRSHLWHHPGLHSLDEFNADTLNLWYTMTAIILATVYSICCNCLQQDGIPAGAHTQVAFHPNLVYGPKVYEWVSVIGNALSPVGATSAEWIGMLLEVVTGIEHPTPLNDLSDHTLSRSWQIMPSTNTSLETTNVTDVFGTQANGIYYYTLVL